MIAPMMKMTAKRLTLSVLAVFLVLAGYRFIANTPFSLWWHAISTPSAGSIAQRLRDPDPEVRREALGQVDYIKRHDAGVIAGFPLVYYYPERESQLLLAFTELTTKDQIDELVKILGGAL